MGNLKTELNALILPIYNKTVPFKNPRPVESTLLIKTSRQAGITFFFWIATAIYGMLYTSAQIGNPGDIAIAAKNILASEFQFRSVLFTDLLGGALWIVLAFLFYQLFCSVDRRLARLLVALVLVQIPVGFISISLNLTSLMLLKGQILTSLEATQRADWAMALVKIVNNNAVVMELFWGLWLFPLAALIHRSHFLPRFLSVWLAINGLGYVLLSVISLMLPQFSQIAFTIGLPAFFGEVVLMLWLLIKGVKPVAT